jgi:uncharacterized membrane protein YecN with MAPEG domain
VLHGLKVKVRLHRRYRQDGGRFDRYFGQDREMLASDRYQGNMLEHLPAFLALLWLHAVFAGTWGATAGGAVYVATRVAYPILLGSRLGDDIPQRVLVATFSGYAVLVYFCVAVVRAVLSATR